MPPPRPSEPPEEDPAEIDPSGPAEAAQLQPGDWYMEGPYLVFTEQYHLRRGYCCNSGCRHCPYK